MFCCLFNACPGHHFHGHVHILGQGLDFAVTDPVAGFFQIQVHKLLGVVDNRLAAGLAQYDGEVTRRALELGARDSAGKQRGDQCNH